MSQSGSAIARHPKISHPNPALGLVERNIDWWKSKERHLEILRKEIEDIELAGCTF
jgi:hypothetical protein